jgi:hypothetical protein
VSGLFCRKRVKSGATSGLAKVKIIIVEPLGKTGFFDSLKVLVVVAYVKKCVLKVLVFEVSTVMGHIFLVFAPKISLL